MSLEERLAALSTEFKQAPIATGGGKYELPEDGTYQAVIERFDTFEGKNGKSAGQLFLKTEMSIRFDEKYEGREVSVIHNLEDPERFDQLKRHLVTLGLDPEGFDFARLLDELHAVLDVPVEIAVVTSNKTNPNTGEPYRNCYINRRIGDKISDLGPVDPDEFKAKSGVTASDDETIPF